jgi:hypothetical protein
MIGEPAGEGGRGNKIDMLKRAPRHKGCRGQPE